MSGAAVAAAARALVGVRFRLHGRDAAHGMDCVGVAAAALRGGGWAGAVPSGYALRGGDRAAIVAMLDGHLVRADGARPGDVVLVEAGPAQWHLAVRTAAGAVHADAALRRVVERPGSLPWPVVGAWRIRKMQVGEG